MADNLNRAERDTVIVAPGVVVVLREEDVKVMADLDGVESDE